MKNLFILLFLLAFALTAPAVKAQSTEEAVNITIPSTTELIELSTNSTTTESTTESTTTETTTETTTTLMTTSLPTAVPLEPVIHPYYLSESSCDCDLTADRCDVNCCCDQDCTTDEAMLFSSCWKPPVPHFLRKYCSPTSSASDGSLYSLAWNNTAGQSTSGGGDTSS